jgi:hypothetical protein
MGMSQPILMYIDKLAAPELAKSSLPQPTLTIPFCPSSQSTRVMVRYQSRNIDDGDQSLTIHPEGTGMSTVFISYSQKDKEIAAKVRATLEANDIKVTIDSESMDPGEDIRAFIDRAIRDTQVTLSIVSRNSLSSDWVALESVGVFCRGEVSGREEVHCLQN